MSANDQDILARIERLAGQINRHKNQQAGLVPSSSTRHNGGGRGNTWQRGGASYQPRGYRVGKPTSHRHRSLVLNQPGQPSQHGRPDVDSTSTSASASDASGSSWVTKTDRHLQLINSNVYEKDAQARSKAIEQTRRQKQQQRDDYERSKLSHHFRHVERRGDAGATNGNAASRHEVVLDGIRFHVTKGGSKLVRAPDDRNLTSATPKTAVVGGVKFYRSKKGNLYRHGVVRAQRHSGAFKKINQVCQIFSTTGSCSHGPRCRYIHDPSKVAACKGLLQKGTCTDGDLCDLSHDLTPERTPHCLHFGKGNCTNPHCRYAHVQVSPGAPVCRPFGIYGFCEKGVGCSDRHALECPDFSNTGVCKNKRCKLPHRERASVLRKANAEREANPDVKTEDLSSDDESEPADDDDVDSDEVEEFIGEEEGLDLDFATQKDFIEL